MRGRVMSEHTHTILRLMVLLVVPIWAFSALPADSRADDSQAKFLFSFENDFFGGSDKHYTSAIKFTWVSRDIRNDGTPPKGWGGLIADKIPLRRNDLQQNLTLSFGQNMYTPEDTAAEDLIVNDRPYAGWTYLSLGLHTAKLNTLDSFELTIGVVGPSSLAEKSQKLVHEWINDKGPNGWNNQLNDEPGLLLTWERHWRSLRTPTHTLFAADLIPHTGLTLGNVYTYANAGFEARMGYNFPADFGSPLIRPGGGTAVTAYSGHHRWPSFGFVFFAGIDGRAIARNIFLDGNTFRDSHSVDKNYFVADLYAGATFIYNRLEFTYTHVYRTEEFKDQDGGQYYGSFTISWTY